MTSISKTHTSLSLFKKWKNLTPKEVIIFVLVLGFIVGGWLRLYLAASADFPIGDGGLFYVMIQAIQANSYHLPKFITYNGLLIPFSYPPFAFYLVGIATDILHTPLIDVMRWFPAIILTATFPAVYLLANSLLRSQLKASLTVSIFALLPRSITWLIKGGGVTRSVGQLFLILATVSLYFLFKSRERKYLLPSILFSSLVCITHLEAAIHTVGFGLVLWLFYGKNKEGVYHAIITAVGTLVSTSVWWLPTVTRHGLLPFINAASTGFNSPMFYIAPLFLSFTDEPFLPIIALLAIIGIAAQLAKREFLIPTFYLIPFIIEPRNAPNVAIIPTAILASIALTDVLLPITAWLSLKSGAIDSMEFLKTGAEKFLFFYLASSMLIGMQLFIIELRDERVTIEHRNAFNWIKNNIPKDNSLFLVITDRIDSLADPLNEWFPVLTDHTSLTTVQGYEWIENGSFGERIIFAAKLQGCNSMECIETTMQKKNINFNYIYISNQESRLALDLLIDTDYQLTYGKDGVQIFQKK